MYYISAYYDPETQRRSVYFRMYHFVIVLSTVGLKHLKISYTCI